MAQNKVRVLIVDDSLTIRAMISTVFEKDPQVNVVGVADSAEEAEQMLQTITADVITLDIKMPGMDGLEFLSKLKARWPNRPVIMLSSLSPRGAPERVEALRRGAVASFNKANALSDSPRLLKMIKDAAQGKLKPDQEDAHALALIATEETQASAA